MTWEEKAEDLKADMNQERGMLCERERCAESAMAFYKGVRAGRVRHSSSLPQLLALAEMPEPGRPSLYMWWRAEVARASGWQLGPVVQSRALLAGWQWASHLLFWSLVCIVGTGGGGGCIDNSTSLLGWWACVWALLGWWACVGKAHKYIIYIILYVTYYILYIVQM